MATGSDDIVELYRAAGLPEAHAIRIALETDGIPARIDNESLQGAVGELPFGWNTAPRVVVNRANEPAARAVLARYLQQASESRTGKSPALHCLACGEPMGQTNACPKCGWSYQTEPAKPTAADVDELDEESADGDEPATDDKVRESAPAAALLSNRVIWWEIAAVLAVAVVPNWVGGLLQIYHPVPPAPYWLDSLQLILWGGGLILLALYLISRSGETWARFGITRPRIGDLALAGVMLLVAEMIWRVMPYLYDTDNESTASLFAVAVKRADYAWLSVKYLFSAFAEELITRGYLITRLHSLLKSRGLAVLVAALFFSSSHLYQGMSGMLYTAIFGLAYGVCFLCLGRIWPLALGHALFNVRIELLAS